jgi:predicted porin
MRTGIKTLMIAIAAVLGLGLGIQTAAAQTVEDLRRQIEQLNKRLDQMEEREKATEVSAAKDKIVSSGNSKIKLELSGQVNRGVLFVDNGDTSEVFNVDNDNSSTRIRFIGKGRLNEDVSVGTQIEVQFESNSTAAIRIDQDSPAGPNNFTERKLEIYGDSKTLGRVWVGQGDTASNGTSEVDLSGTSVVAYSGIADMAGGIAFATSGGALGPRINQAFSNFDGLSRDDRIRYDTPSSGGFKGSISALDGGSWDAAARFSGKLAGTKVVTVIAYADADSRQGFSQVNGSVSVLLPFGVSVTGAAGTRDVSGRSGSDPMTYYGKLGYRFRLIDMGETAIGIDFARTDDLAAVGDEFTAYGAFAVQRFDAIGTELYVSARNHDLDRTGSNFDDIFAVLTGARIKF